MLRQNILNGETVFAKSPSWMCIIFQFPFIRLPEFAAAERITISFLAPQRGDQLDKYSQSESGSPDLRSREFPHVWATERTVWEWLCPVVIELYPTASHQSPRVIRTMLMRDWESGMRSGEEKSIVHKINCHLRVNKIANTFSFVSFHRFLCTVC